MPNTKIAEVDTTRPGLPGYVVIGRGPGDNAYLGIIEHSFSMDFSPNRVRFWWTGTGTDNFFGKQWKVDGQKSAVAAFENFSGRFPSMTFEIYDVDDPQLPIVIDWPRWHEERDRKFEDRNPAFSMRDMEDRDERT